jgi:hypothetical protein
MFLKTPQCIPKRGVYLGAEGTIVDKIWVYWVYSARQDSQMLRLPDVFYSSEEILNTMKSIYKSYEHAIH